MLKQGNIWLMPSKSIKWDEQYLGWSSHARHQYVQTLHALNLCSNSLGGEGANYIADALKLNQVRWKIPDHILHHNAQTLHNLNLWDNKLGAEGAKYLADMLKVNQVRRAISSIPLHDLARSVQTLQILNLQGNNFGAEGAKYLGDALKVNQVGWSMYWTSWSWSSGLCSDTSHSQSLRQQCECRRSEIFGWCDQSQSSEMDNIWEHFLIHSTYHDV